MDPDRLRVLLITECGSHVSIVETCRHPGWRETFFCIHTSYVNGILRMTYTSLTGFRQTNFLLLTTINTYGPKQSDGLLINDLPPTPAQS
jgi:hypothetical protein